MEFVRSSVADIVENVERGLEEVPKWQLIVASVSLTSAIVWLHDVIPRREDIMSEARTKCFRLLRKVPVVRRKVEQEMNNLEEDIHTNFFDVDETRMKSFFELPKEGIAKEEVVSLARTILELGGFEWQKGKVSGGVNAGSNPSYTELMVSMFKIFSWSNPLHSDIFPGIRKMEAEIVRITANLMHGDQHTVGCMTCGGSESILLAMKAYRNWARATRGIEHPEVVAADTVHAAVEKGANILAYKFRKVGTDPKSWKANMTEVERAINKNTILLVASAPDYSHGIIDDVAAFSSLGLKYDIPVHVDCCLGGFILPFMDRARYSIPPFDFRLPGVTSISADTHKYGNSPKGTSVIVYRKEEFRHHQYFVVDDWPGGIYATAGVAGSRSGANIAMCWAALLNFGNDGFVQATQDIIDVARRLKQAICTIDGLYLLGDPLGPIVSFASRQFNIVKVADLMMDKGWHLQPLQNPPGMHVYFTSLHTLEGVAEEMIEDLKAAVEEVRSKPEEANHGWAKLYGSASALPDKSFVVDAAKLYLKAYYTLAQEKAPNKNNELSLCN